jgi:hypothetical protein
MATIRGKVGDWATLAIDLLYAHLDASFIVNHLETTNAVQTSPLQPRRAKKRVYNSFGLNNLRRYGPVCDESLPYPTRGEASLRTIALVLGSGLMLSSW